MPDESRGAMARSFNKKTSKHLCSKLFLTCGSLCLLLPALSMAADPNTSPQISGEPATSIYYDQSYEFIPEATDADGDSLAYSITNKPAWAQFDTATGTLSGQPAESDEAIYSDISIAVTDSIDTVSLPTFDIAVHGINNAPVFTIGADHSSNKNGGRQWIEGWAEDVSDGNLETQNLQFVVLENSNTALFSEQPSISLPSKTLRYRAKSGAAGEATLQLALKDNGGTDNGGVDISEPQSFRITIDGSVDDNNTGLFAPGFFDFNNDWLAGLSIFDNGFDVPSDLGVDIDLPPDVDPDENTLITVTLTNGDSEEAQNVTVYVTVDGVEQAIELDNLCDSDGNGNFICQLAAVPSGETELQIIAESAQDTLSVSAEVDANNDNDESNNVAKIAVAGDSDERTNTAGGGALSWLLMPLLLVMRIRRRQH